MINLTTVNTATSGYALVLMILGLVFWYKNRDMEAIIWWCGFPFFRIINEIQFTLPNFLNTSSHSYLEFFFILVSEVFLLIGCYRFTGRKINIYLIALLLIPYAIGSLYLYANDADVGTRLQYLAIFDSIPLILSIYILQGLDRRNYCMEKHFTSFWLLFQLMIFFYWALTGFDFVEGQNFGWKLLSIGGVYICHVFIIVGLLLLIIAKKRHELILENIKHRKLQEELEETLIDAQEANEEKNQFLTNMSHELRTPLNAINGFSESLKLELYGPLNKKQKEYVSNIFDGGELLLKLVTDLLNLSHVEEGVIDISPENVDINLLITKTKPLLEEIIEETDIKFYIQNKLNDNVPRTSVYIDQIRVKQILINFMSNAAKYGRENGNIHLIIEEKK